VTPRDQIARLEGLLERVRKNATKPRVVHERRAAVPEVPTPVPPKVQVAPAAPVAAPVPRSITPVGLPVAAAPPPPPPPPPPPAPPPVAVVPPVDVPAWRPEPGSSVQSRPSTIPPEELSDDDLLEVTTIPPATAAEAEPAPDLSVDVDLSMDDEEPPVSSSRSKVAATIDEALARAAEPDEEREVPVKTPPPESGPQAAGPPPAGLEAPRLPDVDSLEADDMLGPPSMGPTTEQLGETIELEAPRGPTLEIDVSVSAPPEREPERPPEELEVNLPRGQMPSGLYDLPPVAPPAQATPPMPAVEERTSSAPPEPRPTARPELGSAEIARVVLGRPTVSHTFVDVLDRSLKL
jgi:hypothetical protein